MKVLFAARGLPLCAWRGFVRADWERSRTRVLDDLTALGLPLFVKPANLGSSVGISKVKSQTSWCRPSNWRSSSIARWSSKPAVPNAREIECAVLGNDDPEASVPGEIIPSREFYDYEAKYLDDGSKSVIPADLPADRWPRCSGSRSRRSTPSMLPDCRAWTSCCRATPARWC